MHLSAYFVTRTIVLGTDIGRLPVRVRKRSFVVIVRTGKYNGISVKVLILTGEMDMSCLQGQEELGC